MTEERLKEIKDSLDFQAQYYKMIKSDNALMEEELELYNEVIRLREELNEEKEQREYYQAIVEHWE